jgi:hypothetical protein
MKNNNLSFNNNDKIIIAIIGVFTFCFFAIAGYGWHFYKEEIDLLYSASKIKTLKELWGCFLSGNVSGNAHPSNYNPPPLTFFTAFYRPMLFLFAFIQYSIMGIQSYGYYLCSIGFHCINIPLIFYFLRHFVSLATAILCALLFAFHPSFAAWIGNANMQQYSISTTCIIVVTLLIKRYFTEHTIKFLVYALFLFSLTLFIRETIIIAPVILLWLWLLFQNKSNRSSIIKTACISMLFFLASIPYLIAKAFIFPISLNAHQPTSFTNFAAKASLFLLQIKLFIYDFLSVSWFPDGYPIVKVCLLGMLFLGFILLLAGNSRTRYIIAAFGCMALLLWPAILIGYFVPSRFFYEATPAYLFGWAYLIEYVSPMAQKIGRTFIIALIICNICYAAITIHRRTIEPAAFYHNIMKLKNFHDVIYNRKLCFFGLSDTFCWTGLAQQLWFYKINNGHQIFILSKEESGNSVITLKDGWINQQVTFISWDSSKHEFYVYQQPISMQSFVATF